MRIKYLGLVLSVLTLFVFATAVFAETIPAKEAARLTEFLKKKLGAGAGADTKIDVKGYDKSPIAGFKKGTFSVKSKRGAGDIGFLVSEDGKYLILNVLGEPVDTTKFAASKVPSLKKGAISVGKQSIPILMSNDGKYIILADLMDTSVDPYKDTVSKISLKDVPTQGDKNAKVTIVEYSDFQCPFCAKAVEILPPLMEQYKGKVKVVYKQFPLPMHQWAKNASIASICAYKQDNDKFWKFHDLVFQKQKEIKVEKSKEQLLAFAGQVGLDKKKMEACYSNPATAAQVQKEMTEGQMVGVNSTPSFIVNGELVTGANPEGLKAAIDRALAAK